VVALQRIDALRTIQLDKDTVRIGAGLTAAELAESETIRTRIGALAVGAVNLGTPLVRNLATIGGNIGSARPAADLPPPLMAYGARAVLKSLAGERVVPLPEIFKGPGITSIKPEEVLTGVIVDIPAPGSGAGYQNLGVRKAQDCNIVNVASYLSLDDQGHIDQARIVMGCVGPTHLRAPGAEGMLKGEKPGEDLFARAGEAASADAKPIHDFRGSAEYKRAMVGVLTQRTLLAAWQAARR
jgi:carbon-monoxide dehydrogenase medium subunit